MARVDKKDASYGLPSYRRQDPVGDKEILASAENFVLEGVTILAGAGALDAGTILGRVTASGKYRQYLDTASDGSQVPRGILRHAVDASTTSDGDKAGEMFTRGIFKRDQLVTPANGTIAEARVSGGAFGEVYDDGLSRVYLV